MTDDQIKALAAKLVEMVCEMDDPGARSAELLQQKFEDAMRGAVHEA